VTVKGLDRRNPILAASAALQAGVAVGAARRVLSRREADVVMGGGGYVSGPAGIAAVTSGVPLVLTEADSHLGLANRLLAGRAWRVCLAFAIPGRDSDRYLVTGRPVPAAVITADRNAARERFGIATEECCLLVFGGSQGARSINDAAIRAFAEVPGAGERGFQVLHVAGHRDHEEMRRRLDAAGPTPRYTLLEYEPNLGDALAASDLVLARAGGSVFEIAAAGRPAILVPYPHATADHQGRNAAWMVDGGAAVSIPDGALTPEALAERTQGLLADPGKLEKMAAASRALAKPDAAERIAAEVLSAADG
jgi:UDP-N-acetylglucosamine--N-acetylmuramyl-(pentapeptide) pyrophosphoryl-undecaprenol N-acetylglucosamine transferase